METDNTATLKHMRIPIFTKSSLELRIIGVRSSNVNFDKKITPFIVFKNVLTGV